MQIFVIGMHRSGTSTVARLLNMMGVYFGPEGSSTAPNVENPKGFWERKDVRSLNDHLLQSNGLDWDLLADYDGVKSFSQSSRDKFDAIASRLILGMDSFRPWFLKEPRFCLTFPLWKKHLEVPLCVYVYRDPVEVARSLSTRNGFPLPYGLAMWEAYNVFAIQSMKGHDVIPVSYNSLINDPVAEVESLFQALTSRNIPGMRLPLPAEIKAFVSQKLYRHKKNAGDRNLLSKDQLALYEEIQAGEFNMQRLLSKQSRKVLIEFEKSVKKSQSMERGLKKGEMSKSDSPEENNLQKEKDLRDLKNEVAKISATFQEAVLQMNAIRSEYKERELEIDRLETLRNDQATQIHRLDEELVAARRLVGDLKEENAAQELELKDYRDRRARLEQQLGEIEGDRARLQRALNEAEQELARVRETLGGLETQRIEQQNKINELRNSETQLRGRVDALTSEIASLRAQLLESKEGHIDTAQQLVAVKDENILLREDLQRITREHTAINQELREENILLQRDVQELSRERTVLGEQLSDEQLRLSDLNLKLYSLTKSDKDLRDKLSKIEKQLAERSRRVKTLEAQIREKDELIIKYWNGIQSMRIVNRLKRLFFFFRISPDLAEKYKAAKKDAMWRRRLKKILKQFSSRPDKKFSGPKVSIIILNRNGIDHLKRLFHRFHRTTGYSNYEIIIVDNNSDDGSAEYIGTLQGVKLIRNSTNESFSAANNRAAMQAQGSLLLFLNNDVEPLKGWLYQLVRCYGSQNDPNIGLIGSLLIYPRKEGNFSSLKVQHNGIVFRSENYFIRPLNDDNGRNPLRLQIPDVSRKAGVTAACVLVEKQRFFEVGGFDESYLYGYEDVDLSLKMHYGGYNNYLCGKSVLLHYEFGTQSKDKNDAVSQRRRKNAALLTNKWYRRLYHSMFSEKIEGSGQRSFTKERMTVAFAVTEANELAAAGDYFTAKELGTFLKNFGWNVTYLERKRGDWYDIPQEVDVLIVMLHNYDISRIKAKRNILKIVWMRNWFEKFAEDVTLHKYDIVLTSSAASAEYIYSNTGINPIVFPIAGNHERFNGEGGRNPAMESDYCFTGSYWNDPRDIVDFLDPKLLPEYTFHLYGSGWDAIEKFRPYLKGFVPYESLPDVYRSTRVLIDDANRVTKPWGSVNSRVYDAILSGVLPLTNNVKGANETFDGILPVFKDSEELMSLLRFYLSNEDERKKKVRELQDFVSKNHTYEKRAIHFRQLVKEWSEARKLSIKVPAPTWEVCKEWGDFHMAIGLRREFEKFGVRARIQMLREWDNGDDLIDHYVLVLRGLSQYQTKSCHINLMWNISHPDLVSVEEYQSYHHAFVASAKWTDHLLSEGVTTVSTLFQCTDPEVFKPVEESSLIATELLFVGNSRGVMRKIIKDLTPIKYDLSVYGSRWEGNIDSQYIKGEHINNRDLRKYYGGAKVLLNDHWDDMREKGFISNRLFDALACEAVIVSDEIEGMHELFNGSVITYQDREELDAAISNILDNFDSIKQKQRGMYSIISEKHTFAQRVRDMLSVIHQHQQDTL